VAEAKKTGVPAGIFQPTTLPEPVDEPAAEQGGEPEPDEVLDRPAPPRTARSRKRKASPGPAKAPDMKLYLSESVMFRLRVMALKRKCSLSAAADSVLDKNLPHWNVERAD
jgi:hypothetical protein